MCLNCLQLNFKRLEFGQLHRTDQLSNFTYASGGQLRTKRKRVIAPSRGTLQKHLPNYKSTVHSQPSVKGCQGIPELERCSGVHLYLVCSSTGSLLGLFHQTLQAFSLFYHLKGKFTTWCQFQLQLFFSLHIPK